MVKKGEVYRHFKGRFIYIDDIAKDSETLELKVIYHHIDEEEIVLWVRDMSMFEENIDVDRPDNIMKQEKRFEKIILEKGEMKNE